MIGLLSFAGVGCSDFLEVTSDQELTYDTFYKTASDCRSATAALYNAVWFNFNSKFMWEIGDARANNMYIDLATYASSVFYGAFQYGRFGERLGCAVFCNRSGRPYPE